MSTVLLSPNEKVATLAHMKNRVLVVALLVSGCTHAAAPDPIEADAPSTPAVDAPLCTEGQKIRLYPDVDGDGFGDARSAGELFCGDTPGFVVDHTDCADQDMTARPSQSAPSGAPIVGATSMGLAFDYNCDGVETPQKTTTVVCQQHPANQCGSFGLGWAGGTVPACGVVGSWVSSCQRVGTSCSPAGATQTPQLCL